MGLIAEDKKTGESVPAGRLYFSLEVKPMSEFDQMSLDSYTPRKINNMPMDIQGELKGSEDLMSIVQT